MVRIILWLQLLPSVLLLKQSDALSNKSGESQEDVSLLDTNITVLTELKHSNEEQAGHCHVCQSLLKTAQSGKLDFVKYLARQCNDTCATDDKFRKTPLIYAAESGKSSLVRVLLEGGANVDKADANGNTPLHHAALKGHWKVCRLLLDWGAKVDSTNLKTETPLHEASRWGHKSLVRLLVKRGADVRLKNDNGQTASDLARSWGRKAVAEWLDSVSRRVRRDVNTAVCNGTATDCLTTSVLSQNQSAILQSGQQQMVQTAACDPTEKLDSVSQEVEKDCGPQDDVCSSLHMSLLSGDVNAVKTVIRCSKSNCIDGDAFTYPPLVSAARSGRVEMVRVMLEACANVDRSDIFGFTALHVAANGGHLEVCRLLLDWGATVNARDRTQNTPLHWAAWRGYFSVVKLLVEKGADVSLQNDKGLTASDFAWWEKKGDVAEWLDLVSRG